MSWIITFIGVFVPLFVALSPLTVLPIFLAMTDGMNSGQTKQLAGKATSTAFVVAAGIVLIGQALFRFLGITVDDLRVAGGLILLIIAIYDLLFTRERRKTGELGPDAGVVPLGTPLIVGPATMTTCVVLADSKGKIVVLVALSLNLLAIWLLLYFSENIKRYVPTYVSRAFGKVMSLFLAAIAVAMLRKGIFAFLSS